MKKIACYTILAGFLFAFTAAATADLFPQADISNGIVHARFYLPDTAQGYYRATRFDWSGVVPDLEWNHHTYCATWFDHYDPLINDAIMGPVESFSPLGYDAAKAGGHFVQVGVGALSKPAEAAYSSFNYYPVLNYGSWKVKTNKSSIEFTQVLQDPAFAYEYKKTATLVKGRPVLVLQHSLKNTGWQAITTSVFNHNLFVIDGQATGPGFDVSFPFHLNALAEGQRGTGDSGIALIKDNQVVFKRAPAKRESIYCTLEGYGNKKNDYDIKIENHTTGAAVRITGDQPLSKLVFWGSSRIFSPEPYINMNIAPGQTFTWQIAYEFYSCTKN